MELKSRDDAGLSGGEELFGFQNDAGGFELSWSGVGDEASDLRPGGHAVRRGVAEFRRVEAEKRLTRASGGGALKTDDFLVRVENAFGIHRFTTEESGVEIPGGE